MPPKIKNTNSTKKRKGTRIQNREKEGSNSHSSETQKRAKINRATKLAVGNSSSENGDEQLSSTAISETKSPNINAHDLKSEEDVQVEEVNLEVNTMESQSEENEETRDEQDEEEGSEGKQSEQKEIIEIEENFSQIAPYCQ